MAVRPEATDGNGKTKMPNIEPSNAEILNAIKGVSDRVIVLEDWKRNEDAYRAALAKVKSEEQEAKVSSQADDFAKRRTEIMKQVGIVLGLVAAILYAYAATKGIHP